MHIVALLLLYCLCVCYLESPFTDKPTFWGQYILKSNVPPTMHRNRRMLSKK